MISLRVSQWIKVPAKKITGSDNDGIRGGPWTGPVRTYVPVCTPWSGQGSVCGVARDSTHEEYCTRLGGREKKKKKKKKSQFSTK